MSTRTSRGPQGPHGIAFVSFTLLVASGVACGFTQTQAHTGQEKSAMINPSNLSFEDRAKQFIGELAGGEFAHPKTAFDHAMSDAASEDNLRALWKGLEGKFGSFQGVDHARQHEEAEHHIVLVTCKFGEGKQTLRVVFDREARLAGLFIAPPESTADWKPPAYAHAASFEEREARVGTSPVLPGTLTLPKGSGPFPAVVLVHGSGPNDRDETVGAQKPFKDLAWGLASRGIAVLRYEKRTRIAPKGIVTQKDEVETPARDAIELLGHTAGVDPKRIFLLGHSQGGYLAPRIATANPGLAGVVILAGSTQPLEDSLVDQFSYFTAQRPNDAPLRAKLDEVRAFKQRVEAPELRPDEDVAIPLGGSIKGAYFLDVRGYDPPAVAKTLSCPILILQGERDYQVTMKDFGRWKTALASRPSVTLKTYAPLNHLFSSGSGTPGPEEYARSGHVDDAVIADIAAWLTK